jgi:ketosteroid isomerase-like protein
MDARSQDLTKNQLEPWSVLQRQVALYFERDWDAHDQYIHPKIVDWGDMTPAPIQLNDASKKYWRMFEAGSDKVVAHHLVPVSVVVVGDVAIINAYLHMLTKPDGKPVESVYRLHNTWKKEQGRWQLLATYNTTVKTGDDEDDD